MPLLKYRVKRGLMSALVSEGGRTAFMQEEEFLLKEGRDTS
jgi:hypothetical protein